MPMHSELAESIEFKSPGKAFAVVESLQELLKRGLIEETSGTCGLAEIQQGKPWPADFIEIEIMEIATGYRFKLAVETHHGAGGSFKKIG